MVHGDVPGQRRKRDKVEEEKILSLSANKLPRISLDNDSKRGLIVKKIEV